MATRRLRGRKFRWGVGFEGACPFPGSKLQALSNHCHDFIEATPPPPALAASGYNLGRYAFEMFAHGFVLHYDRAERAWVLDIVAWPPRKRRTSPNKAGAPVARANPAGQSSPKRNLYSSNANSVRSRHFRVNHIVSQEFDLIARLVSAFEQVDQYSRDGLLSFWSDHAASRMG